MPKLFPKASKRIGLYLGFGLILLLTPLAIYLARNPKQTEAAWSQAHSAWIKRKKLNVVNSSAGNLSANTTIAITVDTKALYNTNYLQSDCDDLRVLYQSGSTVTELTRHLVYPSGTTCSTSTATKVFFPLQAALNAAASSTTYYMYYGNSLATTPANTDNAFDISTVDALLVCPFNGTTTCAANETPSTETGAIRYSGTKSALSFDANNDYLNAGSNTSLDDLPAGDFTYETWFYANGDHPSYTYENLVNKDNNGSPGWAVLLRGDSNNNIVVRMNFSTTNLDYMTNDSSYNYSQWTHLAVVYIAQNKTVKIYINGNEVTYATQTPGSGSYTTDGARNLEIGRQNGNSVNNFWGYMDETRISNVIRYTGNFTPQTTPFTRDEYTKLLFHFDENGDDPRNTGKAIDDSGLGNHGTITGAKFVSGLVGVDVSTSVTGYQNTQSYAGQESIFIEEGTTNLITNPSFDHTTYNTNWDAVGANLTASENMTAPYYKFGSKSLKLVANASAISGTSNMDTIGIDPNSTATHTLSFYAYDGTSGNVGGTITSSIVKPVWEGVAQSGGSYTDMGGGWWLVKYSTTTTDATNEYGVEAQVSKTVYIDGVQLENKAYATTYTDGSLGTGYAWTSTAHDSTSTRTRERLSYSASGNITNTSGTLSMWVKSSPSTHIWSDSVTHNQTFLFTLGSGSGTWIRHDTDGNTRAQIDGVNYSTTSDLSDLPQSTWQHIVLTWNANNDSGTDSSYYYRNGSEFKSLTGTALSFTAAGIEVAGGDGVVSNTNLNGSVSDLRIYNTALTSTQISDLYYSGLISHSDSPGIDRFSNTNENPVAIYHFDEGNGSTVYDSSRNANNLTTYGPTWEVGSESNRSQLSRSLKFDGTNDIASSSAALKGFNFGADSFSVSSWFRHSSTISGTDTLLSRYGTAGYKIYMDSSGYVCGAIDDDTTWGPDDSACSTVSYADSKWHHVELVKNATTDLTLYVDGNRVGYDNSIAATGSLSTGSPLFLGSDTNNSNYWDGFIDEMYFYGYARSASEAKQDFLQFQTTQSFGVQSGDPLTNGLVGWWKMDESSWTNDCATDTTLDYSGNNLHGDACPNSTGPTGAGIGKFGNSGSFDGSNDVVSVADSDILSSTKFTVAGWINPTAWSGQDVIIGKGNEYWLGANFTDANCTANKLGLAVYNGTSWVCASISSTLSTGTWYHVAGVYDGSKVSIYLNGNLEGTPIAQTPPSNQATAFGIGSTPASSTTYPFNGKVDDVRAYNRALSPAEISQLYNWTPGPVGYWKLDEGTGTNAADSGGLGHDLTLTNTPSWTTGKFGGGLSFSNSNAHLTRADDSDFDFIDDADMSYEVWFKHAPASAQEVILSKFNEAGYKLIMESDGDLTCALDYDSTWTPTDSYTSTAASYDDGNWHHVACVKSGAASLSLYIDGVYIGADSSLTATNTLTNSDPLYVGIDADGTSNDFTGSLDEVKIYNYARTSSQIVEDMNAGHPAPGSPVGSPILHLKMDEGYGDTINDLSQNNNDGNLAASTACPGNSPCPSWTNSGKMGKALQFDGSDDYAEVPHNDELDPSGDYTISLWTMRTGAGTGSLQFLVLKNAMYGFRWTGTNLQYYDNDYQTASGTLALDTWTHLVMVHSATTKYLYINGQLDSTDTAGSPLLSQNEVINIGRYDVSNLYQGVIDELKLYNSALTADQVKVEYNQGKAQVMGASSTTSTGTADWSDSRKYCPPGDATANCSPILDFAFDEASGSTAYDKIGNTATLGTGKSWGIGKYGGSLSSSSTAGTVQTNSLAYTTSKTFSMWLYQPSSSPTDFISQIGSTAHELKIDLGGLIQYDISCASSGKTWDTNTTAPIGQWYHLSITYNGSNCAANDANIYVNGVKMALTETGSGTGAITTGTAVYNISSRNTGTDPFVGNIDNFRVYDYVQTPAQIAWNYNQGAPQLHYDFNTCSGSTLYDVSPKADKRSSGTNATIYPVSNVNTAVGSCSSGTSTEMWNNGTTGKYNASVDFDGNDDYAASANLGILAENTVTYSNVSWGGWFKPATSPTSDTLIHKNNEFRLTTDGNGYPQCEIYSGSWQAAAADTVALPTSTWSHVLCTYDGANIKLYVNGILKKTLPETDALTSSSATALNLARDSASSGYFDGQMDEVKIWSYDLTAQQVKLEYNHDSAVQFK